MRKLNVAIIAGLVVAVLGFAGVFYYATTVDNRIADGKRTVSVLVAKSALPTGALSSTLTSMVQTKDVPQEYVADGYLNALTQVSGLVLLGPIAPGVQLNRADFGQPDAATAAITPKPGRLAVAVGVDLDPGVARYITPNSRVDMFVTYDSSVIAGGLPSTSAANQTLLTKPGVQDPTSRTRLFMSGVTVLSVTEAPAPATGTGTTSTTGTVPSDVLVILDLSPTDSEKVINAEQLGKIYLGLAYSTVAADGTVTGEVHTTPTGVTPNDVINPTPAS